MSKRKLNETHPELINQWHPTKNETLTPQEVSKGSRKKVWWKCEKGHEWEAMVYSRTAGSGCPYCRGKYPILGKTDLATLYPELKKEWHPFKNNTLNMTHFTKRSNKSVWWQCLKGHEWEAKISDRTKGKGCPYCSGRYSIVGQTDLATTHPDLLREWHPTKNGELTPQEVTQGSGKKIWWCCDYGHEWEAALYHRTNGTGCPKCSSLGTSFPEQMLWFYLKQVFPKTVNKHQFTIDQKKVEADLFVPELNLTIEYDGYYWHKDKDGQDRQKSQRLASISTFLRIREANLPSLEDEHCLWTQTSEKDLEALVRQVFDFILTQFKLEVTVVQHIQQLTIDLSQDRTFIIEQTFSRLEKDSLAQINPQLASEWHPIRNGKLTPSHVKRNSNQKVWWQCKEGHEWEATIDSRTSGNNCPYCAGKRPIVGQTDLATTHPELAKEWHPTKNGEITPQKVTQGSGKKFWWQCEKGHEWEAVLNGRSDGSHCPYCSNQKVLPGFNDLATTHPHLLKEWHPTKNKDLSPNTVVSGNKKKVWWKCEHGHEWETEIHNRAKGTDCPYCKGKYAIQGKTDLAQTHPQLANEWHPNKNHPLTPHQVSSGSNKRVWWQCEKGHEWDAIIANRKKGQGCPYCSGRYAIVGETDLATTHPQLANEWHPTKNKELTPQQVKANSTKKVWWLGKCGHEWEALIPNRAVRGDGCVLCKKKGR